MAETPQNIQAIRIGHFRLELVKKTANLATDIGNLRNFGACNNGMLKYITEVTSLEFDNTGEVLQVVDDETVEISAEIGEISISNLDLVNSGLGTVTSTTAAPVAITDETHVLNDTDSTRLLHKMGVRSEVGSIVVTCSGTSAARNTDYVIGVDADGYTTIARVAGSTVIADGATVLVDYSYTPLASEKITFGGKGVLDYLVARVTHVDKSDGKGWSFIMPKVKIQGGFELRFPAIKRTEPMLSPITLTAIKDTALPAGEQLLNMEDEQVG